MAKGSNIEALVKFSSALTLKVSGGDMEELIAATANVQEIAAVYEKGCGKCKKAGRPQHNIRFNSRTEGKFTFNELICNTCKARLSFGKSNEGNLFPHTKEKDPADPTKSLMKDGKPVYLPDGGWLIFDYATKTAK